MGRARPLRSPCPPHGCEMAAGPELVRRPRVCAWSTTLEEAVLLVGGVALLAVLGTILAMIFLVVLAIIHRIVNRTR